MSRLCIYVTVLACLGGFAMAADEVPTVTFESGDYVLTFDGGRF